MVYTGHPLTDFDDVSDMADFYFGVITREASQEDIDKLVGFLHGERDSEGNLIASADFAQQFDEFEAFLQKQETVSP